MDLEPFLLVTIGGFIGWNLRAYMERERAKLEARKKAKEAVKDASPN